MNLEVAFNRCNLDIKKAYEWLILHFAEKTAVEIKKLTRSGMTEATAKNYAFYEYCKPLAIVYVEYTILSCFCEVTEQACKGIKATLDLLMTIYATSSIKKHIAALYAGKLLTLE